MKQQAGVAFLKYLLQGCAFVGITIINSTFNASAHENRDIKLPTAQIIAQFTQRPGNPSITPDNRMFMSIHPLDNPDKKMVEVMPNGTSVIYPSKQFSYGDKATIKAAIAIRTDDEGIAWILDFAAAKIYAWDTHQEKLLRTIFIPRHVRVEKSFMQDFALDQKRNRIIIADMTQADLKSAATPAFIVIDLISGRIKRMAESHIALMPTIKGGLALNPITIDSNYEWVYFGALHGRTIYRVPAESFNGDSKQLINNIEVYGPKPFSDGITVDSDANVYITDIEQHAIGVTTAGRYRIIANLPKGQSWPDGFSFGPDNYIYATVNQLNHSAALNQGQETGKPPYLLVRIKALAPGNTGR
jgi:sugar lactone lactonase YvrE